MKKQILNMDRFGKSLSTRALGDEIFSSVERGADLVIDFKNVQDASPSFCHEMLSLLRDKETRTQFINVSETIKTQISKARNSL